MYVFYLDVGKGSTAFEFFPGVCHLSASMSRWLRVPIGNCEGTGAAGDTPAECSCLPDSAPLRWYSGPPPSGPGCQASSPHVDSL